MSTRRGMRGSADGSPTVLLTVSVPETTVDADWQSPLHSYGRFSLEQVTPNKLVGTGGLPGGPSGCGAQYTSSSVGVESCSSLTSAWRFHRLPAGTQQPELNYRSLHQAGPHSDCPSSTSSSRPLSPEPHRSGGGGGSGASSCSSRSKQARTALNQQQQSLPLHQTSAFQHYTIMMSSTASGVSTGQSSGNPSPPPSSNSSDSSLCVHSSTVSHRSLPNNSSLRDRGSYETAKLVAAGTPCNAAPCNGNEDCAPHGATTRSKACTTASLVCAAPILGTLTFAGVLGFAGFSYERAAPGVLAFFLFSSLQAVWRAMELRGRKSRLLRVSHLAIALLGVFTLIPLDSPSVIWSAGHWATFPWSMHLQAALAMLFATCAVQIAMARRVAAVLALGREPSSGGSNAGSAQVSRGCWKASRGNSTPRGTLLASSTYQAHVRRSANAVVVLATVSALALSMCIIAITAAAPEASLHNLGFAVLISQPAVYFLRVVLLVVTMAVPVLLNHPNCDGQCTARALRSMLPVSGLAARACCWGRLMDVNVAKSGLAVAMAIAFGWRWGAYTLQLAQVVSLVCGLWCLVGRSLQRTFDDFGSGSMAGTQLPLCAKPPSPRDATTCAKTASSAEGRTVSPGHCQSALASACQKNGKTDDSSSKTSTCINMASSASAGGAGACCGNAATCASAGGGSTSVPGSGSGAPTGSCTVCALLASRASRAWRDLRVLCMSWVQLQISSALFTTIMWVALLTPPLSIFGEPLEDAYEVALEDTGATLLAMMLCAMCLSGFMALVWLIRCAARGELRRRWQHDAEGRVVLEYLTLLICLPLAAAAFAAVGWVCDPAVNMVMLVVVEALRGVALLLVWPLEPPLLYGELQAACMQKHLLTL